MASLPASVDFLRKYAIRILICAASLGIIYAVTGFFIVPRVILAVVPEKVSTALGRPFSLAAAAFNPFTFSLHLKGVILGDPGGGDLASVGAITANADILPLLTGTPTLKSLVIEAPVLRVQRNADGSFNFSDLVNPAPPSAPAPPGLPALAIGRLWVSGARVQWLDNAVTPAFAAAVTGLNLDAAGLGTRTVIPATFTVSVDTDLGAKVKAEGEFLISARSSRGHVQVTGVPLARLGPYVAPYFKGRIDGGRFSLALDYHYPSGKGGMGLPALRQASIDLADFRVSPPTGGPLLVDLKRLAISGINLEPAESFLSLGAVLVTGPRVNLVRQADGRIDLLDLVTAPKASPPGSSDPGSAPGARPWRLAVTTLEVSQLAASVTDRAAALPSHLSVGAMDLALSGFTLISGKGSGMPSVEEARLSLTDIRLARADGGPTMVSLPRFSVEGIRFTPDQQEIRVASVLAGEGDIRVVRDAAGRLDLLGALIPDRPPAAPDGAADNHLPPPATDAPGAPPWVVRVGSAAVTAFTATFTDHHSAAAPSTTAVGGIDAGLTDLVLVAGQSVPEVADARLSLSDILLTAAGNETDIVSLSRFAVAGVRLDPENRSLVIGSVSAGGGDIRLVRGPDGRINLAAALQSPAPAAASGTASPDPPKNPFDALPVTVTVTSTEVSGLKVQFTDQSLRQEAQSRIENVDLKLGDLSTAKDARGTMDLRITGIRDGTLSASGRLSLNPPAAALTVAIDGLSIVPAQPYVADKIHALITKGKIDASGELTGALPWAGPARLEFTGKAAVNNFASVDQKNVMDLLNWHSLYLSGIEVNLLPLRVRLAEVALTDYYARVAVNPDGSVNLREVMGDASGPTAPAGGAPDVARAGARPVDPGSPPQEPDIRIAKITLQGGQVDFSDHSIQPTFDARMLNLGGTISGLSSETLARADVFLAGNLENQSPLKITGKINPLIEDQYTDIQIEFSDIDLSPFSPYSGKYIGRRLDKGKLTLVLGYKINGKKLTGDNKVYLDQFMLGESVESPEAIDLPLDLAVALLKDSSGRIALDLPVSGNLNDPEFSIGGVVVQMLINTITKLITAPFAALGGMIGGGPELSYVDFDAGARDLSAEAVEKLGKLLAAMVERPAVAIEVQGQVNPETDGMRLRQQRLVELVRSEKRRELIKNEPTATADDGGAVSPEDVAAYIPRIYERTDIAKPRNPDGSIKVLPVEEMQKLIFADIDITEDDLRRLAMARAEAARAFLLADERIASGRVFLRDPDLKPTTGPDGKPAVPYSRVNFAISN